MSRGPFRARRRLRRSSGFVVNAELEGYQDQLLSIRQDAPGIVAGLTDEEVNWRPEPHRWSIGECFGHLNVSAKRSIETVDEAIARARARGLTAGGPFAYPLLERLFVRSLEPPPKFRTRARSFLEPARHVKSADVLREFFDWQDQLQRTSSAGRRPRPATCSRPISGRFLASLQPRHGHRDVPRPRAPPSLAGAPRPAGPGEDGA